MGAGNPRAAPGSEGDRAARAHRNPGPRPFDLTALASALVIWLSALLVFGALAVIGVNVTSETPVPWLGSGQIIQGIPGLPLAALWGGVALGVASLARGRRLPKLGVLLLEIPPVVGVTAYVFFAGALPPHSLSVEVGDPFPGYALADQDGALHEVAALEKRPPALYIFYRGHW